MPTSWDRHPDPSAIHELTAGFYDPQAGAQGHLANRDATQNPADPPTNIRRTRLPAAQGSPPAPYATAGQETVVLANVDFPSFRAALEGFHNGAHGYFANVNPHNAFRDKPYTGPHPHHDHLHVELTHDAAAQKTPWFNGGASTPVGGSVSKERDL